MHYFTADTHFSHKNISKYTGRPFSSVEEMNDALIKNWNKTVSPNDIVYHLGDFAFGNPDVIFDLINRLNGKIYFVFGNHDEGLKDFANRIKNYGARLKKVPVFLGNMAEIKIDDQTIVLNHYCMKVWRKSHYGSYHLYGHSHGTLPDNPHSLSLDVGVDCHNYKPVSFDEIKILMSKKYFKPIDHHGTEQGGGIGLNREEYAKEERRKLYNQLKEEFES